MTALLPWERLGGKVGDRHLARLAVVYVRQSTRQQVLDHGESTRLQDGLVQRAVGLGWPASLVLGSGGDHERGRAAPAPGSACWPVSGPRRGGESWPSGCRSARCAAPRGRRPWTPTSRSRRWCG